MSRGAYGGVVAGLAAEAGAFDARDEGAPGRPGARVLVVDDERKTLEISRDILEMAGYVVDTAASGQDALERLETATFRAVITDIRMPGLSGIDLLQRIRRRWSELPVIILTGHATLETAAKAVEHGAFEYLFKPIDFDALKASLRRAVERYELVLQNRQLVQELRAVNQELSRVNLLLEQRVEERTRALVLERDLLDNVFAEIPAALAVLDGRGQPASTNPAWTRLGAAGAEALERLRPEARALGFEPDGVRRRELVLRAGTPEERVLAVALVPLSGGRALVVLDDRTTERHLEDELVHAEKLGSLGMLAGGIVHDLSSPITAVLGALDMLADRTPPAIAEELDMIRAAGEHMRGVCEGLSDFARRASSGARGRCDLNALAERALAFARFSRSFDHVKAALELHPERPEVLGDPTELVQVLLNLVINGADASPPGSVLQVRTRVEAGHGVFEVEDKGHGVPVELRERIFDPFFTTKPRGKGTGLGLYIARRVVRRLGGEVGFAPAEGGGTIFRVTLPAARG